jgi:hypothetical protein
MRSAGDNALRPGTPGARYAGDNPSANDALLQGEIHTNVEKADAESGSTEFQKVYVHFDYGFKIDFKTKLRGYCPGKSIRSKAGQQCEFAGGAFFRILDEKG